MLITPRTFVTRLGAAALLLAPGVAPAQEVHPETLDQGFVIVVDDIARVATKDRPMFIASNYGGWDPAKPEFEMSPRSDGKWQYVFDERPDRTGTIQFKFTLGSWDYVETDPDGNDIDNRTLHKIDPADLAPGEKPVYEFRVPKFRSPADVANERQSTEYRDLSVTGDVRRLQVAGGAGDASGTMRDLQVWLPAGYDDHPDRVYPVLYMFDGQNLFEEDATQWGDWGVDETATRLIEDGAIRELIIVGVPNAGAARAQEYVPFDVGRGFAPRGDAFRAWFVSEVMPRVERAFRVSTDASDTGIGGASYGAVIALHIASSHPDRFGALLLESYPPVDRLSDAPRAALDAIDRWPDRVFMGVGDSELGDDAERNLGYVEWNRALRDQAERASEAPTQLELVVTPGAAHNERAWRERFPGALRYLFPAP